MYFLGPGKQLAVATRVAVRQEWSIFVDTRVAFLFIQVSNLNIIFGKKIMFITFLKLNKSGTQSKVQRR